MIKLKDLLNESSPGFENRKFGDPLPTIFDIAKKHKSNKEVDEGIADDDAKAADKIHGNLKDAIEGIDDAMALIKKNLSSFNAPGLRHAFTKAIASATSQGKFDVRKAHKILNDYFK